MQKIMKSDLVSFGKNFSLLIVLCNLKSQRIDEGPKTFWKLMKDLTTTINKVFPKSDICSFEKSWYNFKISTA